MTNVRPNFSPILWMLILTVGVAQAALAGSYPLRYGSSGSASLTFYSTGQSTSQLRYGSGSTNSFTFYKNLGPDAGYIHKENNNAGQEGYYYYRQSTAGYYSPSNKGSRNGQFYVSDRSLDTSRYSGQRNRQYVKHYTGADGRLYFYDTSGSNADYIRIGNSNTGQEGYYYYRQGTTRYYQPHTTGAYRGQYYYGDKSIQTNKYSAPGGNYLRMY